MTNRGPLGGIREYLGIGELWFDLSEDETRKLGVTSILPMLAVLALLVNFWIDVLDEPNFATDDVWGRLYRLTSVVQTPLTYVGLAGLVISGIGRVGYGQGSWAFVFALTMIVLGFIAGMYATGVYVVADVNSDLSDYHLFTALALAGQFGLLAMGYGFMAYRGLSQGEPQWDEDAEGEPA